MKYLAIFAKNTDMGKFVFQSIINDINLSEAFKVFAVPSPDKDYSVVMKYYRYEQLREGDYQTKHLPNFYSELHLFIRKKDKNTFSVYKYDGNVWIHRHLQEDILYDDIMNLAEVSTDVRNEWNYLVRFVK